MRNAIALLIVLCLADQVEGQLISPNRKSPLNSIAVEIGSEVPANFQGDLKLTFGDLDIYFDGGSHGARFQRSDGGKLTLFFPHAGYWTPAAIEKRIQPVAIVTKRGDRDILVEMKPDSKLNQRIIDLLDADISSGQHSPEKLDTLKRIRESVRKRTLLKEIADQLDSKGEQQETDAAPFGDVQSHD